MLGAGVARLDFSVRHGTRNHVTPAQAKPAAIGAGR
jgi:hypothetical protein